MDWNNPTHIFQFTQTATLIVAVLVALYSIYKQRQTAKKDKTIALLMKDLEDRFLNEGLKELIKIHHNQDDDVAIYANVNHSKDKESIAIRNLLNYYENVAVGVKADIYDIEMIKKSQKTMIIAIYTQAKPFIERLRKL